MRIERERKGMERGELKNEDGREIERGGKG
jgi:hypothetical protein